jgi:hypothetical protein
MKWLPIICLLSIVACGKSDDVASGAQLGRFINPLIAPADLATQSKAQILCQRLADKDNTFRTSYLNDYTKFNFATSMKGCVGNELTSNVVTKLRLGMGQLEYNLISGNYFSTQVETAQQGVISALCSRLGNLTKPLKITEDTLVEYEITSGTSTCSNELFTECIVMRTAFRQETGQYLVTMEDRFVINTQVGALRGMVKRHERFDLGTCTDNKQIHNVSVFSGITN